MSLEAERGGEGCVMRAWSRQPSLLQSARPGARCGRRKVERRDCEVRNPFYCGGTK